MSSAAYVSEGEVRLDLPADHMALTIILPGTMAQIIGQAIQNAYGAAASQLPAFPPAMTEADIDMVSDKVIDQGVRFGWALVLMTAALREYRRQRGIATESVSDELISGGATPRVH